MLKHLVFKRGKSNDRDMYFLLKVLLTAQMPKPLKDGTPAGGTYTFKVVAQVAKIGGLTGNPTFPSGCLSQEERSEALMDIKAMLRRGDVNEIPFDHPLKSSVWKYMTYFRPLHYFVQLDTGSAPVLLHS